MSAIRKIVLGVSFFVLFFFNFNIVQSQTSQGAVSVTATVLPPASSGSSGSGGGGGGGGGGATGPSSPYVPTVSVVFSGKAYPSSAVTLLRDAQIVGVTVSGSNADFQLTLNALSAGSHLFSLYSEDKNGQRSSLSVFPVSVTAGVITNVNGIFLAPTLGVSAPVIKKGELINFFGQTAPSSDLLIQVSSDEDHFLQTKAGSDGVYLVAFNTTPLDFGDHVVKSRSTWSGQISSYSQAIGFEVNESGATKSRPAFRGDVNYDGKVNIIDFSIFAFWYKRPLPPADIDLNNDNKVDLIDFSILAFYWTG